MAHSILPNLSGLKLSGAEDEVGAVQGDLPVVPPGTSERDYEDVYDEGLFGQPVLSAVAASVENNEIIASFRPQPMYETFPGGLAFHTVVWWFNWQHSVNKRLIGEGTHNKAFLVTGADLPPDELFTVGYGLPVPPPRGMIVRTGMVINAGTGKKKPPPTKAQHISEMITAAYAHAHGFGPVIYAQFYIDTKAHVQTYERTATPPGPWDAAVPAFIPPGMGAGQIGEKKATFTCTIAEAWQGDCHNKISSEPQHANDQFDPDQFAKEFVTLCARAADAGFWHMDIKRANLLYRTSVARPLELSFTDFDSHFCRILAPDLRADTRRCCIAATVACFLGEIRCMESREAWLRFADPIREAMKTDAGVDLDAITPMDWCFFLRNVGETREVQNANRTVTVLREDKSWYQKTVGARFRNHLHNYFKEPADGDPDGRCFQFVEGQPLFPQVVEFAFVTQLP